MNTKLLVASGVFGLLTLGTDCGAPTSIVAYDFAIPNCKSNTVALPLHPFSDEDTRIVPSDVDLRLFRSDCNGIKRFLMRSDKLYPMNIYSKITQSGDSCRLVILVDGGISTGGTVEETLKAHPDIAKGIEVFLHALQIQQPLVSTREQQSIALITARWRQDHSTEVAHFCADK